MAVCMVHMRVKWHNHRRTRKRPLARSRGSLPRVAMEVTERKQIEVAWAEGGTPEGKAAEEKALADAVAADEAVASARRELQVAAGEEVTIADCHADVRDVDHLGRTGGVSGVEARRLRRR